MILKGRNRKISLFFKEKNYFVTIVSSPNTLVPSENSNGDSKKLIGNNPRRFGFPEN